MMDARVKACTIPQLKGFGFDNQVFIVYYWKNVDP
jgi:hypothetical protein